MVRNSKQCKMKTGKFRGNIKKTKWRFEEKSLHATEGNL